MKLPEEVVALWLYRTNMLFIRGRFSHFITSRTAYNNNVHRPVLLHFHYTAFQNIATRLTLHFHVDWQLAT